MSSGLEEVEEAIKEDSSPPNVGTLPKMHVEKDLHGELQEVASSRSLLGDDSPAAPSSTVQSDTWWSSSSSKILRSSPLRIEDLEGFGDLWKVSSTDSPWGCSGDSLDPLPVLPLSPATQMKALCDSDIDINRRFGVSNLMPSVCMGFRLHHHHFHQQQQQQVVVTVMTEIIMIVLLIMCVLASQCRFKIVIALIEKNLGLVWNT